jgi:hypothetical protein
MPSFKHFGLDYRALKVLIYCASQSNFGRPHFAPDNRSTLGKRISEKYDQKYRKEPLFNAMRRLSAWPYIGHFFAIGVVPRKTPDALRYVKIAILGVHRLRVYWQAVPIAV